MSIVEAAAVDDAVASQARKRRMERRAKQSGKSSMDPVDLLMEMDQDDNCDDESMQSPKTKKAKTNSTTSTTTTPTPTVTLSKDVLAKIPGVKKQARYVPITEGANANGGEPLKMSKEELTLWRKEARRVRNRESAAASRQKTHTRIAELEAHVSQMTSKYRAALQKIVELEAGGSFTTATSVLSATPCTICTSSISDGSSSISDAESAWMPAKMSSSRRQAAAAVSPPLSPRDSLDHSQEHEWSLGKPLHHHNPQDDDLQDQYSSFPLSLSVPSSSSCSPLQEASSTSTSINKYQQRPSPKISRPFAVKISVVDDTTNTNTTNATTSTGSANASLEQDHRTTMRPQEDDEDMPALAAAAAIAADPLSHWSDVTPTMNLPPPPPPASVVSDGSGSHDDKHQAHHRSDELEMFATDMELLGDFLMDAMADPQHQEAPAAAALREQQQYYHHCYEEEEKEVFDVEQQLPPPPLMLPPAPVVG